MGGNILNKSLTRVDNKLIWCSEFSSRTNLIGGLAGVPPTVPHAEVRDSEDAPIPLSDVWAQTGSHYLPRHTKPGTLADQKQRTVL